VLRTREDVPTVWDPNANRLFSSVADLVDRAELRREVWRAVDPHLGVEPTPRIIVVQGELDVGRRAAVRSALLVPYLHGRRVVVSKLRSRAVSFEEAMRAVRDDVSEQIGESARPAHDRFSHKLAWLVDGMEPPPRSIGPVRDDSERTPFNPRNEKFDSVVRAIFTAFAEMLVDVAGDTGLLLVIDRPSAITPKYLEEFVVPYFVEKVANGLLGGVQLLLIDTPAQFSEPVWDGILPRARRLEVPYFGTRELPRLVREYGVRRGLGNVDLLQRVLTDLARKNSRWSPVAMHKLQGWATDVGWAEAPS
jgi:hypothetical protein